MATPLVTNIAPANGTVAAVGASSRFSVRDADTEIDRATLNVYTGTGPVYYPGGALPEDLESPPTFYFQALSGSPGVYAERTVLGDDFLRINKNVPSQNQEAVYFMGGLEAPAEPTAPLMLEFTLRLNRTEVTVDGAGFSGVLAGLLINNSGLTVKFFTNAGVQKIEIHDAALTTTSPPSGAYISMFDWDEAVALNSDGSNTFSLLWHPQLDLVKLFVKDPATGVDQLLITGATSDFTTVPGPEQRDNQPWAFFGHGNYPSQVSISEWIGVYLFDVVKNPIRSGIISGEHVTTIQTNNQTYFDGKSLPRDAQSAWLRLPDSFGTWGGGERITSNGLVLERSSISESIGFYRIEAKMSGVTVLDVTAIGEVRSQEPSVETSGMEFYIDDGVRQARLALLQGNDGTQYIGLLVNAGVPESLSAYSAVVQSFGVERTYRIILTPGVSAEVRMLTAAAEGVDELSVVTVPYASLPASSMPGPGVGFLHNANSGGATASLTVKRVRYATSVDVTDWSNVIQPVPTWTKVGSGTVKPVSDSVERNFGADASIVELLGVVTISGVTGMVVSSVGDYLEIANGDNPGIYLIDSYVSANAVTIVNPAASGADAGNPSIQWEEIYNPSFVRISDASSSDNTLLQKEYPSGLQSYTGWSLEFRTRVVSYEHDPLLTPYKASGLNPIRSSTGFMVQVLDGTYRTALVFADSGAIAGKVVFLAVYSSSYDNVIAILSRAESVVGTYASVDWSMFHLYRLEHTVGGRLRLFIDESVNPVIDLDCRTFEFPPHVGGGNPRVEIGHEDVGILTISDLQHVKLSFADGFDVSSQIVLSEKELLQRFKHGTSVIVEAQDI
jgi:hypothetical protein